MHIICIHYNTVHIYIQKPKDTPFLVFYAYNNLTGYLRTWPPLGGTFAKNAKNHWIIRSKPAHAFHLYTRQHCKKRRGGGDKVCIGIENRKRKKSRPLKRWIDVKEEDKRGVVQQDAGDRHGWRRRAVKRLPNLYEWGKFTRIIKGCCCTPNSICLMSVIGYMV